MKKDKTGIIGRKEYKKEIYAKAPKGAEVYEVKIIQSIEYYCSGPITCFSNVPGYELNGSYSSEVLRLIKKKYKLIEELTHEDYKMDIRITIYKYIEKEK